MRIAPPARVAGAAAVSVAALLGALWATAAPAGAEGRDVEYLCPKSSGYDCMPGTGYTGQTVWRSYGPGHNCVSYAAYMLQRNGADQPWPGRLGSGHEWDEHARAAGYVVDTTPAVGSIAQWDGGSGHVAYVDEVTDEYIVVTEDNYSGYSSARRIWRDGPTFAEAEFLHIHDLPTAPADDVLWAAPDGTAAVWWGLGDTPAPDAAPFRAASVLAAVSSDDAPVPGDLDGDGAVDLVLHRPGSTTAAVAWGDGRGGFAEPTTRSVPGEGRAQPLVGDLDADGADDVLWYTAGPTADAVWWGRPGHREPTIAPLTIDGTYLPAVADLDGDGADDIALAGPGRAVDRVVWGAEGSRQLRTRRLPPTRLSAEARPVVGDFDGDGNDDIAWSRPGPDRDAVWWGSDDRVPEHQRVDLDDGHDVQAGDFDGDGVDDLLLVGIDGHDDALVLGRAGERALEPAPLPVAAPVGTTPVVADFGWS